MIITNYVRSKLNNIPLKEFDFRNNKTISEVAKNIEDWVTGQPGVSSIISKSTGFILNLDNGRKFEITVTEDEE